MSIRAATMSNSYSSTTRRSGFFQKLVVTFLFVIVIASFMALFETYQKNISFFWMTVLAVLSVGLASGTISRMAFYQWPGFTRFFVVLLVLPFGLFVLGLFTSWQIGIGPLNPWVRGIIPQDELFQLGGAFLVALISLEAWWNPRSNEDQQRVRASSRSRKKQTPRPAASIQTVEPRSSQTHTQENVIFLPQRNSRPKILKADRVRSRPNAAVDKVIFKHAAQPTLSRRKRASNRKPMLQISTFEEHRCPFCLEEVKRNDPRGIKECEVCHSMHHADCWAITGMCQVPHLNS
jgi:ribosomal protein L37AE/L43A